MLQHFRKRRQDDINALSITAAIGWAGLFNGFAGEDGEKVSPQDLIPFTEEVKKPSRVSNATLEIIKKLLPHGALPPVVHSQISQFLES